MKRLAQYKPLIGALLYRVEETETEVSVEILPANSELELPEILVGIEFAFLVGLPGKSGVGGGIVAIYPSRYSIAVWSPRLNSKGNSIMGIKALELFTTETSESIF